MSSRNYLDAIIYCTVPYAGKHFLKYHRIQNSESRLAKFERFARKFQGAWYVNYYWVHLPKGSNYAFRRYLVDVRPASM